VSFGWTNKVIALCPGMFIFSPAGKSAKFFLP